MKKKAIKLAIVLLLSISIFTAWQFFLIIRSNDSATIFINGAEELANISSLPMLDNSHPEIQLRFHESPQESFDYYIRKSLASTSSQSQIENADLAISEFNTKSLPALNNYLTTISYGEESLLELKKDGYGLVYFGELFNNRITNFEELLNIHHDYYQSQYLILSTKYSLMKAISESGSLSTQQVQLEMLSGSKILNENHETHDSIQNMLSAKMIEIKRLQGRFLFGL